jgi:hypothetical protein
MQKDKGLAVKACEVKKGRSLSLRSHLRLSTTIIKQEPELWIVQTKQYLANL